MRQTIQATTIVEELAKLGHATNAQLWEHIKVRLPGVTLPSIHRTTARLARDGIIGDSLTNHGKVILDCRPMAHGHFICATCDKVKDLDLHQDLINHIQSQIGDSVTPTSIVIRGSCSRCSHQISR